MVLVLWRGFALRSMQILFNVFPEIMQKFDFEIIEQCFPMCKIVNHLPTNLYLPGQLF